MANIIAILNSKGGAGKTTLAIHLARALTLDGGSALLVDSDPQGSARDWNEVSGSQAGFPVVGIDRPTLEKDVSNLANGYDWIIIDGAAKLEKMSASAIKAADLVVIPVQPSPLDLWACSDLVEMIQTRHTLTDGIPTAVFQITRAKRGTQLAREVNDAVAEFGFPLLNGSVHDRTIFARSLADGGTALDEEPSGQAAWEIKHLAKQIKEAFDGS